MGGQSESAHFQTLFDSALQAYEKDTGVPLAVHPLAAQLQDCHNVESITSLLQNQAKNFGDFQGKNRVMKLIESTVSILSTLSANTALGGSISLAFPPANAIQAGLAVLLAAADGVNASYEALVDLLQSIEHFLSRLRIYTQTPPTPAMDEILVKIMMELLSTLAQATKELKQGRPTKFVKKLLGEKFVETVLQRLDRLMQDETRMTAAETLKVVYGLVQEMNGKASDDGVRKILEMLHELASDMNKFKRDKLQDGIRSWFSPPDPWKNHNIARRSRHTGTADWFIQGNTFSEWKLSGPSSFLWVHGKPGAGKSVLCSAIIEEIKNMRKSGLASLAVFYYDFRDEKKKDLRGLVSSVLVQLCHQSDSYCHILSKFYLDHEKGSQDPGDDELVCCLKDILELPGQAPIFLIVDGLDECPDTNSLPSPREEALVLLKDLIDSQHPNLRICVTSRLEADIKLVLEPLTFRSISLHDEKGQKEDIEKYIRSVVTTNGKMRRWKPEHKELVIDVLTKRAEGMFRWVYCQLEYLSGCLPGRLRQALNELPDTLDGTYERTLREIKETNWEFAHRLLQCVAVVSRPLCVEELADFLAFDFKAGTIPEFQEDWRLEDPLEAVLSTCSTLLALVKLDGFNSFGVHGASVVQFSHFSVKEYLTSARFAGNRDTISNRYHISMTPAHTLVAQACLGILLHLDENITRDDLKKFPLANYAAEQWFNHARFDCVTQNVEEGMKQLFDPNKPHLAIWVWIFDLCPTAQKRRTERPLPCEGTPLHYAAMCGFSAITRDLVVDHSHDVDSRAFSNELTPLHFASARGHVEATRWLIEHSANVTAQDADGHTPLHWVSAAGRQGVARLFIKYHAGATGQDKSRSTLLHRAGRWGSENVARLLVEYGADVTARNKYDSTPLHSASATGSVEVACLLIEHGADVTAQDEDGLTPLHWASSSGSVDHARLLVEHGADATVRAKNGSTPLHRASIADSMEVVRFLVENGADATAHDKNGSTPLHRASTLRRPDLALFLVEHGADVTAKDEDGSTPLHMVSAWGLVDLARFLVERGADATAQDKDGSTPLHTASASRNLDLPRFLVECGADVTAQDKNGSTPLHRLSASSMGSVDLARFFVEHGADVMAQDKDGLTPLQRMPASGSVDLVSFLVEHGADPMAQDKDGKTPLHRVTMGNVELARFLVERGADVTAQDKNESTPLHIAAMGNMELARFLVERGADVTAQDKDGLTPLHRVAMRNVELARFLVERGADVTAQDKGGSTPLHKASASGSVDLARFLVGRGADTTAQDMDGSTPLHIASALGSVDLARFLVEHGADATAQDKRGLIPLHKAPASRNVDLARFLVERGADATAQDTDGSTPLHKASEMGSVDLACLLVEHGADVTSQQKDGATPLHLASASGNVDLVRFLVKCGADQTAQDKDGLTLLHKASAKGHLNLARFLVKSGADVMAQDNSGSTPLHKGSAPFPLARFLVEHGADVTARDKDGSTPLHGASAKRSVDLVRFLVKCGADVTAKANDGSTPLHRASGSTNVDVTRFLVECGADVTVKDKDGSTSLHKVAASPGGSIRLARFLIENGADVTAQDKDGLTPSHVALRLGRSNLVRLFVEHGADAIAEAVVQTQ